MPATIDPIFDRPIRERASEKMTPAGFAALASNAITISRGAGAPKNLVRIARVDRVMIATLNGVIPRRRRH
jgi:hypothetical protein